MKITLEIDMEDGVPAEAIARRFSNVAGYAGGFIGTRHVKAGCIEVHETGMFGSVFRDANNVKITIDRTDHSDDWGPLKVFASHAFVGRNYSLNCYAVVVAPDADNAAHLLNWKLHDDIPTDQPRDVHRDDMIEVDLSAPKAHIVKDE